MTTAISQFPAGHTFEPLSIVLEPERSRAYRDATGDTLSIYHEQGAVPPLAVAAFALGALLESVGLPPGTLHANESVQARCVVPVGSTIECHAKVAQRSQRGGWVVIAIESDLRCEGATAISARATVLCPAEAS